MSDDTTQVKTCEHPEPPFGPAERAEWHAFMIRTHTVSRCPVCDHFRIWTPKGAV